jgi:hypothetical protein
VITSCRRFTLCLFATLAMATVAACGSTGTTTANHSSGGSHGSPSASATGHSGASHTGTSTTQRVSRVVHPPPSHRLVDHFPAGLTGGWQTISTIGGRPAMWVAERSGVTLVRMDQTLVHLALHAGSVDPGGTGWKYGDHVGGNEIHHLILGFNGGFKFSTGAGGFESFGRTAVPLSAGLGSIVTYVNGRTQIGAWGQGVPARGVPIASVRQNLHLLINHGVPDPSVNTCGSTCWGATIGGAAAVARSGLGILGNGQLLWAAGENLTVAQFADAMAAAGVQRGVQLDINPDWVAGYLYVHHATSGPTPVPVVPGQYGIYGHLLGPYSRDFFTVLSN